MKYKIILIILFTPIAAEAQFHYHMPVYGKYISRGAHGKNCGVDVASHAGSPVFAIGDGRVTVAGRDPQGFRGFGNVIVLRHANGESLYGHLSKILVKRNEIVRGGQKIGFVGSSGRSTGPHLHFEMRGYADCSLATRMMSRIHPYK